MSALTHTHTHTHTHGLHTSALSSFGNTSASMRVFIDHSVLEAYAGGIVLSQRAYYTSQSASGGRLYNTGQGICHFELKSIRSSKP
eukprot:COSAG01_NODE_3820_length_5664_cov_3.383827_5_plen_85_part_01